MFIPTHKLPVQLEQSGNLAEEIAIKCLLQRHNNAKLIPTQYQTKGWFPLGVDCRRYACNLRLMETSLKASSCRPTSISNA